jgi:putative AdoMet-dependent methyltransferase
MCLRAKTKYFNNRIRDEYGTFDWIIEGLLTQAGFDIIQKEFNNEGYMANYLCQKNF